MASLVNLLSRDKWRSMATYRSVCIYAPCFATLALVESVGGAYMRDLTFYLANTPPLSGPRLDVYIGTLRYRSWFDTDLPSLLLSSRNSMVKID